MAVFHIGMHKTATTWLQQQVFPHHPGLALANRTTQPWTDPLVRWLVLGEGTTKDAKSELSTRTGDAVGVVSAERLSGHPAAGWHDRHTIAARIAELDPAAKVVLVVRDQVAILRSIYKELVHQGETTPLADLVQSDSWRTPRFSLAGLDYSARVDTFTELLGPGAVHVIRFEDIQDDPRPVLAGLWEFVGVDPWFPDESDLRRKVNAKADRGTEARRWLNHFRRAPLHPTPVVDLTGTLRSRPIQWALGRLPADRPMTPELQAEIESRFADSNRRLRDPAATQATDDAATRTTTAPIPAPTPGGRSAP